MANNASDGDNVDFILLNDVGIIAECCSLCCRKKKNGDRKRMSSDRSQFGKKRMDHSSSQE